MSTTTAETVTTPDRPHPVRRFIHVIGYGLTVVVVGLVAWFGASYYFVGSGMQDSKVLWNNVIAKIHSVTAPTKTELGRLEDEVDSTPVRNAEDLAAKREALKAIEAKRRGLASVPVAPAPPLASVPAPTPAALPQAPGPDVGPNPVRSSNGDVHYLPKGWSLTR